MTDHSFFQRLDALPADISPTAHLLDELQLYGYRPHQDEPDPRRLPDAPGVQGALSDVFDALVVCLSGTRLEPDLESLLWGVVNLFHRKVDRLQRDLDGNERAQRQSQGEQDGSEVRSVELERLIAEGIGLIERRNAFEFCREQAGDLFETHTGSAWRSRAGSVVDHHNLTASLIDSRDFLAAKRRTENEPLLPTGKAHVLPDGRRVFKTQDGTRVFDEAARDVLADDTPEGLGRTGRVGRCHRRAADLLQHRQQCLAVADQRQEGIVRLPPLAHLDAEGLTQRVDQRGPRFQRLGHDEGQHPQDIGIVQTDQGYGPKRSKPGWATPTSCPASRKRRWRSPNC